MVKFRNTGDERADGIPQYDAVVQESRLDPVCQGHFRSPLQINTFLASTKRPGFAFFSLVID